MLVTQKALSFTLSELVQYVCYKIPFARVVHDKSVVPLLGQLEGRVLEIGAGILDYSVHAQNSDEYIRSDYAPPRGDERIKIDATNIDFPDNSIDSVVCMSTMEHVEDFSKAFEEIYRILKPGGQFLLCVPWLFPYHGAPDDYHRFTSSALSSHLKKYDVDKFEAVGNFWISQAMFLQRPIWSRSGRGKKFRFYDPVLRMIGLLFVLAGKNYQDEDDNYALLYSCLCRKSLSP